MISQVSPVHNFISHFTSIRFNIMNPFTPKVSRNSSVSRMITGRTSGTGIFLFSTTFRQTLSRGPPSGCGWSCYIIFYVLLPYWCLLFTVHQQRLHCVYDSSFCILHLLWPNVFLPPPLFWSILFLTYNIKIHIKAYTWLLISGFSRTGLLHGFRYIWLLFCTISGRFTYEVHYIVNRSPKIFLLSY